MKTKGKRAPKRAQKKSVSRKVPSRALDQAATREVTSKLVKEFSERSPSQKENLTAGEIQHEFHKEIRRATNLTERHVTFPIVGIGASAGGVEALSELFRHIPGNTGMAFVVIMHLTAHRESFLPDILSKNTTMPVKQADHLMPVEPNTVYVIPPNRSLGIVHGGLRLMPRVEPRTQHRPIDFFFRCLADDQKSNAIGVVLSGGDGDGSLGLEAIKTEGGMTFVQDPATAKVPSMPESAVSVGAVDHVLQLDELGAELAKIASHPLMSMDPSFEELLPESESELGQLFRILRAKVGVDFTLYKRATLLRRLKRRMLVHRVTGFGQYLKFIQDHPEEINNLFDDLLINVTSFFRDPEVFDVLRSRIFPKLLAKRNSDVPVRIWVPGCSTGEEAYSLAICLHEVFSDLGVHFPVQVFATDLSEAAIEKARTGFYSENIRTDVSQERLRRFFTRKDGGYQVSRAIRDLCVFAKHDVTRDPPFSRMDFISCRNLLIYLGPLLQKRVIQLFAYALAPEGQLLLGPSETAGVGSDFFSVADKKFKIYVRKSTPSRTHLELGPGTVALRNDAGEGASHAAKKRRPGVGIDLQSELMRILLTKYDPAAVVVNEDFQVVQFLGKTSRFLEHASGEATFDLIKMAKNGLQLELRSALRKARGASNVVLERGISVRSNGCSFEIDLEIRPLLAGTSSRYYIIFFEEHPAHLGRPQPAGPEGKRRGKGGKQDDATVSRLRQELEATAEYLKSSLRELEVANEELQSANEEILSSNEELQSTNEELETAKEELQSSNEELTTVNEELSNRNSQLSHLNDDLQNLLASVNIPIVMVGNDLRVRRFTPQSEKLLNLIPTDVGRPITDIKPNFELANMKDLILETIDSMSTAQVEVTDRENRHYSLRVRPYRTSENRIDGAVMIFVDLDSLRNQEK